MIDTKIACQCGNRFKFGMDLVNGRAPDGLVCPTCGADATPACNVLVDFLAGKEPPPIGVGTRPLKEVRVVVESWRRHYNTKRPHGSLGYKPPAPEVFVPAFVARTTSKAQSSPKADLAQKPTMH